MIAGPMVMVLVPASIVLSFLLALLCLAGRQQLNFIEAWHQMKAQLAASPARTCSHANKTNKWYWPP